MLDGAECREEPRWLAPTPGEGLETPCYVFDPEIAARNFQALRSAIGTPLIVSLKANPTLDLLVRCAHVFIDGVELASIGELNVVVGRLNVTRYVNTPAMDETLFAAAISSRSIPVLDSQRQLDLAIRYREARPVPGVMLRLNAASLLRRRDLAADHFGMDVATALSSIERLARAGIPLKGLHVFTGSNSFNRHGVDLLDAMDGVLEQLEPRLEAPLELVNLGGGFPERWADGRTDFGAYRNLLEPLKARAPLAHEAGRAVFASAGAFVTRVVGVKTIDERPFAICDGGLAQCFLLAQTERVIKDPQRPTLHPQMPRPAAAPLSVIQLVGNSCNRDDRIGELRDSPPPIEGDLVVFPNCGAYHTYSPTGFLNLKAAKRYVVS